MPESHSSDHQPGNAPHPLAPAWARIGATFALVIITWFLVAQGFRAVWHQGPDFEYFYHAGRALLDEGDFDQGRYELPDGSTGTRGTLDWYLPVVARFMTLWVAAGDLLVGPMDAVMQVTLRPLAEWVSKQQGVELPPEVTTVTRQRAAGLLWLGMNLLAFIVCVRLLAVRVMSLPRRDWPVVQLIPLVLTLGAWHWEFWLNQIDALTLLLLVGAFVQWERGRHTFAGVWLGLAILLKLTPGLVLIWFALKRQWRVVGTTLVVMVLAAPVGDLIAFGPQKAWQANIGWLERAVFEGSHRALIKSQREMDWRNQATGAVLSRLLHETSYTWKIDNDPRLAEIYDEEPRYVNLLNLPLSVVSGIQGGFTLLLLGGLIWLARKPASQLGPWPLRIEWALFVLAMLWFMPVMRRYHVIMAFPAVCMLAAALHYARYAGGWRLLTNLVLIVVLAIQLVAVRWDMIEPYGGVLFATMLLGVPLIALRLMLGRDERALSRYYTDELVSSKPQQ